MSEFELGAAPAPDPAAAFPAAGSAEAGPVAGPDPAAAAPAADPDATPTGGRRKRRLKLLALALIALPLAVFLAIVGWYFATHKPLNQLPVIPPVALEAMPHYEYSIYGVQQPMGVAVTTSGDRIYVADTAGSHSVRVYDSHGASAGELTPPQWTGSMHTPLWIAIDPATQDVYVSDRVTAAIYIYSPDGYFQHVFKPAVTDGFAPFGMAFDGAGNLYVADVGGPFHRIDVLRTDGTLVRTIGKEGELRYPNGVAVDGRGNVYVTDSNDGRLLVFDPNGTRVAAISQGVGKGDLGRPLGTAIDDTGRLYVVDTPASQVNVYRLGTGSDAQPTYVGTVGGEGRADGAFEYPFGVATDTRARIYVADWANNRVQVWTY